MTDSNHHTFGADAIAIIGMGGRFPGSPDIHAYWDHIAAGRELVSDLDDGELRRNGVDPAMLESDRYVKRMPLLEEIRGFDADFFGYTPREAELMDPQHRAFLECAWQVLEVAGCLEYDPDRRIGITAGSSLSTYLLHNIIPAIGPEAASEDGRVRSGNDKDFLPSRVAYQCNLRGPTASLNTACSTSLVAVWKACEELMLDNAELMLAGGVSISVPQQAGYRYQEGGIASPDGRCRPFDEEARGTIGGNGLGVVLLKKLDRALADGDPIHAVIRGGAVNNDGSDKIGYTAPSVGGQSAVIREALGRARVPAGTVGFIETHGTGTSLGDPIELEALQAVYGTQAESGASIRLGSVKANIGHLDAAAGIAGLIKAVMALKRQTIPPLANLSVPTSRFAFEESPFRLPREAEAWEPPPGARRRAAVSSFGIGGTNAHLVLEEAPEPPAEPETDPTPHLFALSARSEETLAELRRSLVRYWKSEPNWTPSAVARTLQAARKGRPCRFAFSAGSRKEALRRLEGGDGASGTVESEDPPKTVFAFPGQGGRHAGAGRTLYESEEAFREDIDRCAGTVRELAGWELTEHLFGEENVTETRFAQPALFALSWATARWWQRRGMTPSLLIGHSLGEYAAACLAGIFPAEEALRLLVSRGELMDRLPRGAMLAVAAEEERARELARESGLSLAAVNGPRQCVLSGTAEAVAAAERRCGEDKLSCRVLNTSHAFHSGVMEGMLEAYREIAEGIAYRPPEIPLVSNLTGDLAGEQMSRAGYWVDHVRRPVLFGSGLARLLSRNGTLLIETGPGNTLSSLARQYDPRFRPLTSLPGGEGDERRALLDSLARAWAHGAEIDRNARSPISGRRLALPPTPFIHREHWIEAPGGNGNAPAATGGREPRQQKEALQEKEPDITRWFYHPEWQQRPLPPAGERKAERLAVVGRAEPLTESVVRERREAGHDVTFLELSPKEESAEGGIRMGRPDDYDRVLKPLAERVDRVIYVAPKGEEELAALHGQLCLAQSLSAFRSRPLHLLTLSRGGAAVTGKESPVDDHAGLAGSLRVLSQETELLECRLVDLEPECSSVTPMLSRELDAPRPPFSAAIRGRQRWTEQYRRLESEELPSGPPPLREKGTYLVTGGLGNVGLLLGDYLTREYSANLILTGRTPLMESADFEAWEEGRLTGRLARAVLPEAVSTDPAEETKLRASFSRRLEESDRMEEADERRLKELAGRLCGLLLYRGLSRRLGDRRSFASLRALKEALEVTPRYERYVEFLAGVLREEGYLSTGDRWVLADPETVPEPGPHAGAIRTEFPTFATEIGLLEACADRFPDVIAGRTPGMKVITEAQQGQQARQQEQSRFYFALFSRLLRETVERLKERNGGRKLRILEIGGGSGKLTRYLAEALEGEEVEYHFTDVGHSALRDAEERYRGASFRSMKFRSFDITRDPAQQGMDLFGFDLVAGLNVVHATPDLSRTLSNLKKLLRPGGVLGLIETVRSERWDTMIWGLTPAWWSFADTDRRSRSPLLPAEAWERLMDEEGFEEIVSLPGSPDELPECDSALIMGRQPADLHEREYPEFRALLDERVRFHRKRRERFRNIASRPDGGSVLAETADAADAGAMKAVVDRGRERFGRIDGVIHAAGVVGGGSIFTLSKQLGEGDLHTQCRPKIEGLRVLNRILSPNPPDFVLLLSSNASVIGGLGLAAYAAANAFMDTFAASAEARIPCISSNWDGWPEGEREADRKGHGSSISRFGMTKDEAEEVFRRVSGLQAITSRISVSAGPLQARLRRWVGSESPEEAEEQERPSPESVQGEEGGNRPPLPTAYESPENEIQQRLAAIWEELLGISPIGIGDNFFELRGDSLLGTQLISRANRAFRVHLPLSALFEDLTVEAMARRITRMQSASGEPPTEQDEKPQEEFEEGEI